MENIQNVKVGPMPQSQFLKPFRMEFTQNGRKRYWDFIKLHESVSIVIYNTSRKVLIFVKQFRPAVYYNTAVASKSVCNEVQGEIDWSKVPPSLGVTIELCAGILDKPDLSAQEIAKQEVLEECGYDVPLDKFQYVISYRSGIGVSGDKQNLFYAEVTDDMKVGPGGGLVEEGEYIDVVEMSIPEARKFMTQETVPSPGGFLFGLQWFLSNKVPSDV